MYLKRLEIQGFKSFPDKIKLEFDLGITAIVGPNGSGKSNIADAISWVLGEQSPRSLRGLKMEDVIFSGTQRRQGRSYAEVIMVLDNSELKLQLSYTEVSITRRMYRSGESEYYINGTSCRLKDIHQLFTDTGLGKDGYSIISQGRVDEILSVRGEDRRMLFEEAAGILKFKNRKIEAEQKLERERSNLERVNDIVNELEGQLAPMEQQAKNAEKYLKLREYLKLLQINIFRDESTKKIEQAELLSKRLDDITVELESEESRQRVNNIEYRNTEAALEENERMLMLAVEEASSLKNLVSTKDNETKLMEERRSHAAANLDRLYSETSGKERKLNMNEDDLKALTERIAALEQETAKKKAELALAQEKYDELVDLSAEERAISEYNSAIIDKIKQISELESELKLRENMYKQYERQCEKHEDEKELLEIQLSNKQEVLANSVRRREELEKTCLHLESIILHMDRENHDAATKLSDQSVLLTGLVRKKDDYKAKFNLLSSMEREKEGYYKGVKAVLKLKRVGIRGTVGELLYVAKDYEVAVEAALGSSIQNIVTNTEEDAGDAIEFLKKSKDGRVTFMPLSAIKPRELGKIKSLLMEEPGVIGTVKNLISYDPAYENIYSNLLGSVLALDTMEHAVALSRKYGNAYRLVTLQGEIFNPGGSITGGSYKNTAMLVSRSREIAELRNAITDINNSESSAKAFLERITIDAERIKKQLSLAKDEFQEKKMNLAESEMGVGQLTESVGLLKARIQVINESISEVMSNIVETNRFIRDLKKRIVSEEEKSAELKRILEEYRDSLTSRREMKDLGISELSDLNSDIRGLEQMLKAAVDNHTRLQGQINELTNELSLQRAQIEVNEQASEKYLESIEVLKSEIHGIKELSTVQAEKIAELETLKIGIKARKALLEDQVRESGELISNIRAEKLRTELKKEQLDGESRRLHDEMWENYKITRQMAIEYQRLDMGLTQLQREERKIRNEIASMGDVNVNAIDAYKELKKRYEFLTAQRTDIIEAEGKLIKIAADLTKMMEERFLSQFEEISYNFSTVFQEMFGGGSAKIKLSDESNALDSGIEIIAQPPGKSLQNMMLLSGGERSLTAIALLFGILRMNPAPFCVLDEIEAALDEANSARYAKFIKTVSTITQLILVTHKQMTMESADVMYGVTMQEQGISKIIPIKFETDAVKNA